MVTYDDFQLILNSLKSCLTDYSTDQRGDVGSWVRIASMELLNYLLPFTARLDRTGPGQAYLNPINTSEFMAALLKQSVERIDKVRASAGKVVDELIQTELKFPGHDCLRQHIKK